MTWITTVAYEDATGKLRQLLAHSLRPHTMEGHMAIYKNVIHHPRNTLPKWLLEAIGVYVSLINKCDYCVEHHFTGMRRLLDDDERSRRIRDALEADDPAQAFDGRELAALEYAAALTRTPTDMSPGDIDTMRHASLDDGEILEVNQVAAYFNYANRTVLGLGINKDGDILGLSPSDGEDMDNWSHR
jgi:uncharacterized peroxidase-related enzyme